jgi:DNA replication and repair protein RecF
MIQKIYVQNFRKHDKYELEFPQHKTIITGSNGSGKTSLIEAIYISLIGKSWRSSFKEITKTGKTWWRIDLQDNQLERTVKYNKEPVFSINNTEFKRLPTKFKQAVILFEPSDLNLLYNSPAARRNYVDKLISSLDLEYNTILRRYDRILKQRNNLLKQNSMRDDIFIWDIQLADAAASIILTRRNFIKQINKYLTDEYQRIDGSNNNLIIKYPYYTTDINKTRQEILSELHNNYQYEIKSGHTSVGPHQHDFGFYINNKPAMPIISRGENRSVILALKNIEYIFKKEYLPLILLDDVLSEFDDKHQENLLGSFNDNQIIITSVKAPASTKNFNEIHLS